MPPCALRSCETLTAVQAHVRSVTLAATVIGTEDDEADETHGGGFTFKAQQENETPGPVPTTSAAPR